MNQLSKRLGWVLQDKNDSKSFVNYVGWNKMSMGSFQTAWMWHMRPHAQRSQFQAQAALNVELEILPVSLTLELPSEEDIDETAFAQSRATG